MKTNILILHGPNLNLLGEREPKIYGFLTLNQLNQNLKKFVRARGIALKIFQSNHEGVLIDLLQKKRKWADGVVFNPGAYTHYSFALRDAVSSIAVPTVEVHLSDIMNRESFRRKSVIAPVCIAQVSGFGWESYTQGIETLLKNLKLIKKIKAATLQATKRKVHHVR